MIIVSINVQNTINIKLIEGRGKQQIYVTFLKIGRRKTMDRIKNENLKSFIKEVKMVEQERRNKTPLKKSMIIDTIERKSNYIPACYNKIAQETILNKGYAILNLLRKYPDDIIAIDPFPIYMGYKSAEGIKYEDFFRLINYEFINKNYEWVDEWGVKMQYKKI